MTRPVPFAPRAAATRAMRHSLTVARNAAADQACRASLMDDLRLGALVAVGAFVFLMVVLG